MPKDVPPSDENDERPEYYAMVVHLLHCAPANSEWAEGEPASVVMIGRKTAIEALVFSMRDSQTLVVKLLVALATSEDKFANQLLDHFPGDEEGEFCWPAQPEIYVVARRQLPHLRDRPVDRDDHRYAAKSDGGT